MAQGCAQDPANRQMLAELVATLREAELEVLPSQASQNATLHAVCEAWAYEANEFPMSAVDPSLPCSQYAAVMRVMLQVWSVLLYTQHADSGPNIEYDQGFASRRETLFRFQHALLTHS